MIKKATQKITFQEFDALRHAQANGVSRGHHERQPGDIRAEEDGARQLRSQRQGDAPGAGPYIHDAQPRVLRPSAAARQFQHLLYRVFGFRPGNQDVRIDLKIQPPEFLMAGDVLRRLAGTSLVNQLEVALGFLRGQFYPGVRVEKSAVAIENVHQQQFGGELRGRNLVLKEGLEAGFKRSAKLHGRKELSVSDISFQCGSKVLRLQSNSTQLSY